MEEISYQVVFTGKFSPDLSRRDILGNLERLLHKPPAELRALFHAPEAVIVARTSQAMAQKYVTSLNQTGALCAIRERKAIPEQPQPAAPATRPEVTTSGPPAIVAVEVSAPAADIPPLPDPSAATEPDAAADPAVEAVAEKSSPTPKKYPALRTISPLPGPLDLTLSPLLCANAGGHPGGLSTNRKDWATLPFADILLLAAFKITEAADEVKLLLFPASSRRPLLIEAKTIAFAQFPGVAAGNFLPTLRKFLIMIYRNNRSIVLDQATAEFMKGAPPPQFAKDPVILISDLHRALATASNQSCPPHLPLRPNSA